MTVEAPADSIAAADERSLQPDEFLRSGRRDAVRLLVLWYLRKSAYWLGFSGSAIAHLTGRTDEATVDLLNPGGLWDEVWSPLAGLVLAVFVRLSAHFGGWVVAYPLAREYEAPLEPRPGARAFIGKWLDRIHVTGGLRTLRWSHHVRQAALRRLGESGARVRRLDPFIDALNIVSFVALILVMGLTAS